MIGPAYPVHSILLLFTRRLPPILSRHRLLSPHSSSSALLQLLRCRTPPIVDIRANHILANEFHHDAHDLRVWAGHVLPSRYMRRLPARVPTMALRHKLHAMQRGTTWRCLVVVVHECRQ